MPKLVFRFNVGIIYFAFIGYKFLPNKEGSDEGIFDESKDF